MTAVWCNVTPQSKVRQYLMQRRMPTSQPATSRAGEGRIMIALMVGAVSCLFFAGSRSSDTLSWS